MKKYYKLLISTLLIGLMLLGVVGCSTSTKEDAYETTKVEKSYYPVTVEDRFGNQITIEKEPMKVISISPEMTETLYALGVGDRLVGRTDYCNYPEAVLDVDSIGTLYEVNFEKVVDLEADVVFASSHVQDDTVKQLQNQGVQVIALTWNESLEGVYGYMETIGKVMKRTTEATDLVNSMKNDFDLYTKAIAEVKKPSAYFVTGYGEYGDFTATGDTFLSQLMEMAGSTNAAADGENWRYSLEKLVEKDPDYLFCSSSYDSKTQIEALDGYKDFTAVKEGRLYALDENLFFRQGPRLAEGFKQLVEIMHPEAVKNLKK